MARAKKKATARRGTAGARKKPKRTALPGGAPLRAAPSGRSRRSFVTVTAARPKKAKPPCKYGPRGPDGLCPKKPSAGFGEKLAARSAGVKLSSRSKKSVLTRARERAESQLASELAGTVGIRAVKKQARAAVTSTKKAGSEFIARQAEIATGAAASKSVAGNIAKLARAPVIPKLGKAAAAATGVSAGTAAGLAIAAGAGSYFATKWILQQLEKRKEKQITQADVKFQAAMAYRKAREDAKRQLGRELTAEEHKALADSFKENLKTLGGI